MLFSKYVLSALMVLTPMTLTHANDASAPVPVQTKALAELSVAKSYSVSATLVAFNHSDITAQIAGKVSAVHVRVGDRVSQGQPLVSIECGDWQRAKQQIQAEYESTLADLAFAKDHQQRGKALLKKNYLSKDESEQRALAVKQLNFAVAGLKARLAQANTDISRCEVSAPFDGYVTQRYLGEAALAAVGSPLVKLLKDEPPEVEAKVPTAQLAELMAVAAVNAKATNASNAMFVYQHLSVPVSVRAKSPEVNGAAAMQTVYLRPAQANHELVQWVGSVGRLTWQSTTTYVPPDLLVKRDGQWGVMLAQSGRAQFVALDGAQAGRLAPAPLPPNSQIIVKGQHGLVNGDEIALQEASDVKAPAQ